MLYNSIISEKIEKITINTNYNLLCHKIYILLEITLKQI